MHQLPCCGQLSLALLTPPHLQPGLQATCKSLPDAGAHTAQATRGGKEYQFVWRLRDRKQITCLGSRTNQNRDQQEIKMSYLLLEGKRRISHFRIKPENQTGIKTPKHNPRDTVSCCPTSVAALWVADVWEILFSWWGWGRVGREKQCQGQRGR